jgi:hypothetical protein
VALVSPLCRHGAAPVKIPVRSVMDGSVVSWPKCKDSKGIPRPHYTPAAAERERGLGVRIGPRDLT